jgi:undecaprenyl diphosphate synthase
MALPIETPCHLQHLAILVDDANSRDVAERLPALILDCLELGLPMLTLGLNLTDPEQRIEEARVVLARHIAAVLATAAAEFEHRDLAICFAENLFTARCQSFQIIRRDTGKGEARLSINLLVGYDSRDDLAQAVARMQADGIDPTQLSAERLSAYLLTGTLPDPDLIIQTGGVLRLNNFLLWQAAYAEYYAAPSGWLHFDRTVLDAALTAYAGRERRFGAVLAN